MTDPQDIVILIDNSNRSIDGDFYPSRLDAQKNTARLLIKHFSSLSQNTEISIGVLGENKTGITGVSNIGISTHLTNRRNKIDNAIANIEPSGPIKLYQGIKFAFLVLNHPNTDEKHNKRIIVFVGSKYDLSKENSKNIIKTANKEKVAIDIIAFGNDVQDTDTLSFIVDNLNEKSNFVKADIYRNLSDTVLESPIGHMTSVAQAEYEDDPELYYTLEMLEQENLWRSINESRAQANANAHQEQNAEDDNANQNAPNEKGNEQNTNYEEEEEEEDYSTDELNDPDLKEAIRISKQDLQNSDDQKNDDAK